MGIDTDIYYFKKDDYEIEWIVTEAVRHTDNKKQNVIYEFIVHYKKVYQKPILKSDIKGRYYEKKKYTEEGFLKSFHIYSCCQPGKIRTIKGEFIKFDILQHRFDSRTDIHCDGINMYEIINDEYSSFACIDKNSEYFKITTYC